MMESHSTDEEEDDSHHLIVQNERTDPKPPVRSAFQIDDDFKIRSPKARGLDFNCNKWYLIAVFVPLFIIILYFTTDIKSFFQTSILNVKSDASVSSMREAELQALHLLRQQQIGLFKLWDTVLVNDSTVSSSLDNTVNSSSNAVNHYFSPGLLEDMKSHLLTQISLNKQIQQALLSSHRLGDVDSLSDNLTDPSVGALDRCRKVDQKFSNRKTIEWKPNSNKYLFAMCVSGQMSNHLICLEKHIFFAALLNRMLVIPSSKVDYEYRRVLDIDHVNECLGRKVLITFEEFAGNKKNHLHIDKFICYFSLPQPCYVDDDHVKKLKSLGVSMGKLESPWVEDAKKPSERTAQDVLSKFSSNDGVIAIGDVFFAQVEKKWVMQPGGPIAHNCKTLMEPSHLILLTAQRFIQTFIGRDFIALHFRRHGFLKFCNAKSPSCFYPVAQAADCINRVVEQANSPVIYLSTDAADSETGLLQSLVAFNGKHVPLVKRPSRNYAEKWDALLYRHGLQDDSQVEAMLDKTICALSSVFIGSSGSTFTEDILRLRKDWETTSVCDEYLCEGDVPNFIAGNE